MYIIYILCCFDYCKWNDTLKRSSLHNKENTLHWRNHQPNRKKIQNKTQTTYRNVGPNIILRLKKKKKRASELPVCECVCMYALEIRLMNDSNGQWWAHSERRTWGKRIDFGGSSTPLIPTRFYVVLFLARHECLQPSLHQYLLEVCKLSTPHTLPLHQSFWEGCKLPTLNMLSLYQYLSEG